MRIAVASGKGGTGKTTIAVNLALALENSTLVDCDVEEPNANLFLKAKIEKRDYVYVSTPKIDLSKCVFCGECGKLCQYNAIAVIKDTATVFPTLCHSCGLCILACPKKAVAEEKRAVGVIEEGWKKNIRFLQGILDIGEARSTPIIKKLKEKAGDKGVIIFDCPPGTGCAVAESIESVDYCILVAEPTLFSLYDLEIAAKLCNILNVPYGVVINRNMVGGVDVEAYCRKKKVPVLMKIPFKREIAELYSKGASFVEEIPEWKEEFRDMHRKIEAKFKR